MVSPGDLRKNIPEINPLQPYQPPLADTATGTSLKLRAAASLLFASTVILLKSIFFSGRAQAAGPLSLTDLTPKAAADDNYTGDLGSTPAPDLGAPDAAPMKAPASFRSDSAAAPAIDFGAAERHAAASLKAWAEDIKGRTGITSAARNDNDEAGSPLRADPTIVRMQGNDRLNSSSASFVPASVAAARSSGSKPGVTLTGDRFDFSDLSATLAPTDSSALEPGEIISPADDAGNAQNGDTQSPGALDGGGVAVNRRPTVTGPVSLDQTLSGNSILIATAMLLEHASDADGDTLAITGLTASCGEVLDNGDGSWLFVPTAQSVDQVTFSYEVSDGISSTAQTAELETAPLTRTEMPGTAGDDTIAATADSDVILAMDENYIVDGRGGDDVIAGQAGHDQLSGGDGDDVIHGGSGNDIVLAGAGADIVFGGAGNDIIAAGDENDTVRGGAGNDIISGGAGDDLIEGNDGNDQLSGGSGDDVLIGGAGDDSATGEDGEDLFVATVNDGNDVYDGGAGQDTIDLSLTTSAAKIDLAAGTVSSEDVGDDALTDIENAIGGAGDDIIYASAARNVLTGGSGQDIFIFREISNSGATADSCDEITDFEIGDKIDVSYLTDIDSSSNQHEIYEFTLDSNAFTAKNQLRFRYERDEDEREHTVVEGNIDDDDEADFAIDLHGHHNLSGSDFVGSH